MIIYSIAYFQRPSDVQWKESEVRSLIEYIALYYSDIHGTKNPWPRHDRDEFWEKCAEAVKRCSGASKRSGEYDFLGIIFNCHFKNTFYIF